MDYKPVEYPVFRRMDGNVIAGVSGKTALLAAAAALLGFLIYAGLSLITVTQESDVGYAEAAAIVAEYEQMRDAVRFMELADALSTPERAKDEALALEADTLARTTLRGLDVEDVALLAERGEAAGIEAGMSREELEEIMPLKAEVEVPALSGYSRIVVSIAPMLLIIALNYEVNGISALRKMRNHFECRRSQQSYYYRIERARRKEPEE